MTKNTRRCRFSNITHSKLFIDLPAFHIAGNQIFERIATAVAHSRGYPMSNIEYARIMGKATSTTSYWFGVSPQPQLIACFCLLEQLTPEERQKIVDELCRPLPLIDHPSLGHNPATVVALKNILRQNAGLTLITGADSEQRAFLLTALGQTFCRIDPAHRKPTGIDLHEPDKFVPVDTLVYLRDNHRPSETLAAISELWPTIRNTKRPLILLNGVWLLAPQFHKETLALANRRHVIIADKEISFPSKPGLKIGLPVHRLTVSRSRKNTHWLEVTIQVK